MGFSPGNKMFTSAELHIDETLKTISKSPVDTLCNKVTEENLCKMSK